MNNTNKNNAYSVCPVLEMKKGTRLRLVEQYAYKDILRAYLDCRRRKRMTRNAASFEVNFEKFLLILLEQINSRTYEIGSTCVFPVTTPTPREICAALFRDRIIHHLIYADIGPYFEAQAIEDSYACMAGRGTLAASKRLETFCHRATQGWTRRAWCLQVDIASFFGGINRRILWGLVRAEIGDDSLTAWLARKVFTHNPMSNAFLLPHADFSAIPPHKRLKNAKPDCGLPIGNLTSQFGSGVYLDGLDKYVKHVLGVRWYVRYVDDLVLLSHDREELYAWRDAIDNWLQTHRDLHLHPRKTRVAPVDAGIDFVGRIILPHRTYPRSRNVQSAKRAAKRLARNPLDADSLAVLNSHLGHMRKADTFRLRSALCRTATATPLLAADTDNTKIIKL